MHELFIAEALAKSIIGSLPENIRPTAVKRAYLQVGKLEAVVPESLIFMFNSIKAEFGLNQASLSICEIEVNCHCLDCKQQFALEAPIFICPHCGSVKIEVIQGRGIILTRIIIDHNEG
jgi:hydrogenase nickel incorporation protein HypA/HybF